jgi:hypothetical protein
VDLTVDSNVSEEHTSSICIRSFLCDEDVSVSGGNVCVSLIQPFQDTEPVLCLIVM